MPEVYASNEVVAELLNPISGSVLLTITFRQDISTSERPVYVERAYSRSGAVSSRRLRSRGSITLRKTPESFALVDELRRWQKGMVWYNLTGDLKGRTYRHPNLRLTFNNADGTVDRQIAHGIRLSDRSLSVPQGGVVGDSYTLDVLRGFDLSEADGAENYEPKRALDFARTGSATYLSTAGTLTTATDGQPRIGLPYVVRRNLFASSGDLSQSSWTKNNCTILLNQALAPDGNYTAAKLLETTASSAHNVAQNVTVGATSAAFSVYLKAAERSWAVLELNSSATCDIWVNLATGAIGNTLGSPTTATVTDAGNGWWRVTIAKSGFAAGTISMSVFASTGNGVASYAGSASSGIYIWGPQLDAGVTTSTPYQPTNASGVDLTHPLNGAGLVIEGTFTNSLTNPDAPATQTVSLAAGTYTAYLDGTGSVALSGGPTGTVTQSAPVTFTLGSTTSVTFTVSGTVTRFGCVNLPFRPSHISGTKQPDLCGINVPLMNDLKDSHDLTQPTWIKSTWITVSKGTDNTVTLATAADSIYQEVAPASIPGTTRTAAVRLKLGTLSGSVRLRLRDQSGVVIATTTINTTDLSASEHRTFYATGTPGASVTSLRVELIGNSGTGTVIVRSLGLVQGSHPGPEVRTTDSAIAAPTSPTLDPAFSQNGMLKVRILPGPQTPPNATAVRILGSGAVLSGTSANTFLLSRRSAYASNVHTISFDRAHNGTAGSGGTVGRGLVEGGTAVFDSAPHEAWLVWMNYQAIDQTTGQLRRFMPLQLWIDANDGQGVKKVEEIDVAALFGASSWAALDPSKLISDGTVSATISGPNDGSPIVQFPTLPQGAIPAV